MSTLPYPGYHDDHRGRLTRGQLAVISGVICGPLLIAALCGALLILGG